MYNCFVRRRNGIIAIGYTCVVTNSEMQLYRAAELCALAGLMVYCNSLSLDFCFDDKPVIIANQDLRSNVSWLNILKNDFWGTPMSDKNSHKSYRPLTVATFRLNYMLHELQPLGYHLVNVLLHSAVCYLYVLLCGVVFSEVWPALIAGLLFAVHPIHTEAVSSIIIIYLSSYSYIANYSSHNNSIKTVIFILKKVSK